MCWHRRAFCTVILVILTISVIGCGGSDYRLNEKYYLVTVNKELPYWQNALAGFRRAGAELGVLVEMVGPDTYSAEEQKNELDLLIAAEEPPAGILVSAADAELLTPSINAAIAKGINVITIDSDAPESNRLTFVGTDNYSIGVQTAEVTANLLKRAGTVIVFTISGQTNLEDRLRGYREVFDQFPAIRIIEEVDIRGDAVQAFDTTKEMLQKSPNRMDAFVCLEAIACPEVADVLSRNGVRDKVVIGMDISGRTLEWIQQGYIQATIAQRPYTMAYVGLRLLADMHKYPPQSPERESMLATIPQFVDTGATLVTQDNIASFLEDQAAADKEHETAGAPE